MQPRALLCDAAGTLFAPARPVAETYAAVISRHGLRIPPGDIEGAFAEAFANAPLMAFPGVPAREIPALERDWWRNLVESVLCRASAQGMPRDFEACFDALFEYFSQPSSWRLLPGAAVTLETFSAHDVRLGIASNFDLRIHDILTGLGIAKHFQAVVLPAETRTCKPDPRFFRHALAKLGVAAAEAVFLGDDLERDLAGARAVGMHTVHAPGLATLLDLQDVIGDLPESHDQRSSP